MKTVLYNNKLFVFIALFLATAIPVMATAADAVKGPARLMVFPTRIVLEGRERSADLTLINNGESKGYYRIEAIDMVMPPEGAVRELEAGESVPWSAHDMLRLAPKKVIIQPGSNQKVRLLLRKPTDLEDGEYRVHLRIKSTPPSDEIDTDNKAASGVAVNIQPQFNVIIPVIVRHGSTYFTADILDVGLTDYAENTSGVYVTLANSGNRSAVGDIKVFYIPDSGEERLIAHSKGSVLYRGVDRRKVIFPLQESAGTIGHGKLKVIFRERIQNKGEKESRLGEIVAEAEKAI